jgi:hypothetical protein
MKTVRACVEAGKNGWTIINMKKDRRRIFAFE